MSELSSRHDQARRGIDQIYASIPAPDKRVKSLKLEVELSAAYDMLQAANHYLNIDCIAGAWLRMDRADEIINTAHNTIRTVRARARAAPITS